MLQTPQRSPQKGERSNGVTGIEMVERGCHLDESLQKGFLRLFQFQPDALPMFVSDEELAAPVAGKSLFELSAIPVKRHAFSICDFAAFGVPRIQRQLYCAACTAAKACGSPVGVVTLALEGFPTGRALSCPCPVAGWPSDCGVPAAGAVSAGVVAAGAGGGGAT